MAGFRKELELVDGDDDSDDSDRENSEDLTEARHHGFKVRNQTEIANAGLGGGKSWMTVEPAKQDEGTAKDVVGFRMGTNIVTAKGQSMGTKEAASKLGITDDDVSFAGGGRGDVKDSTKAKLGVDTRVTTKMGLKLVAEAEPEPELQVRLSPNPMPPPRLVRALSIGGDPARRRQTGCACLPRDATRTGHSTGRRFIARRQPSVAQQTLL